MQVSLDLVDQFKIEGMAVHTYSFSSWNFCSMMVSTSLSYLFDRTYANLCSGNTIHAYFGTVLGSRPHYAIPFLHHHIA